MYLSNDNDALQSEIISLIRNTEGLENCFSEPPQAMYMPFDKTRSSFYILVSLFFSKKNVRLDQITSTTLVVVKEIIKSGLPEGRKGVEILPCVVDGSKTERVLRLSIAEGAIDQALGLTKKDLLVDAPFSGVTCGWYISKNDSLYGVSS